MVRIRSIEVEENYFRCNYGGISFYGQFIDGLQEGIGIYEQIENDMVTNFEEKPIGDSRRINGGFFILSPKVIEYIEDD